MGLLELQGLVLVVQREFQFQLQWECQLLLLEGELGNDLRWLALQLVVLV